MEIGSLILVANGEIARLLKMERAGELTEVQTFINPASRLKNLDLEKSEPGRSFSRMGDRRSALEKSLTPKEQKELEFARHVTSELDHETFQRLYIVAEPRFLGLIRDNLGDQVKKKVAGEASKDIAHEEVTALWPRIKELFIH